MISREVKVVALVTSAVMLLTAANVISDRAFAGETRGKCHQNLTCDDGLTCYEIDASHECARNVRRADARGAWCLDIAGARGCYASQGDCYAARGVVTHGGGKAGECYRATYPARADGKAKQ